MNIATNHHERELHCFYELPEAAQQDFDYVEGEDRHSPRFFQYKGGWYDANEFERALDSMVGWHGYQPDTFATGVLLRYTDDYEAVIAGRYWI